MHFSKQQFSFLIIILIGFYLLSWTLQSNLLYCRDVSWGLHEAKRLLAGGSYGKDFYDMTPPIFLYLYLPPIIVSNMTSINLIPIFTLYIFLLTFLSLLICYKLTQTIFLAADSMLACLFLFALTIAFLILPLPIDFGQREHLFFILTMPYFLLLTLRLEYKPINSYLAAIIGVFAGFGFCIKPFFLIPLVFIEIYYILRTRNLLAWARIETLTIAVLLFVFTATTYLFYRSYITLMIPLAMHTYYTGYSKSWSVLLLQPEFVYSLFVILFYAAQYKINSYKNLSTVLLIALLGCLAIYLVQRTVWYYHLLPAYSLSILLLASLFGSFVSQPKVTLYRNITMIMVILLGIGLTTHYVKAIWTILTFNPFLFFCYFSVLFSVLLSITASYKSFLKIFFYIATIMIIGFWFSFLVQHTAWYSHQFGMTLSLLILLFILFLPKHQVANYQMALFAMLGTVIFAFPAYSSYLHYTNAVGYKEKMYPLIAFLKEHARHQPVYFFSSMLSQEFPAIDYAESLPASQYPLLVWIPGFLKKMQAHPDSSMRLQLEKDNQYFINSVSQELNKNKPLFVFVDTLKHKPYLDTISYEYLDNFLLNNQFHAAWQHYAYVTTIKEDSSNTSRPMYKFEVYQRQK